MAEGVLRWDYLLPHRTRIELQGTENLPKDRAVILAMNHTDRYNYWPLQYQMYRQGFRFTATWVKGKYYENKWVGRFLDSMNNIPMPSRGYILSTRFQKLMRRKPSEAEYRLLRDLVDSGRLPQYSQQLLDLKPFFAAWADGTPEGFLRAFDLEFDALIAEVVRLNRYAIKDLGCNLLIFPQGTRSLALSRGHIGLMQMAWSLDATVVPIGCNGSDKVYPTNSPWAQGGRIVYRIGQPLLPDGPEFGPLRPKQPYLPLSRTAAHDHGPAFQAATDILMNRINELLDPPYQFAADKRSDGVSGMDRFL